MSEPSVQPCPTLAELELHLGGGASAGVEGHLRGCARCQRKVEMIHQNNALAAQLARAPGLGPSVAAAPPMAPGDPGVEGYDILCEVHRGAQGVVFKAVQRSTHRTVALKVLLAGALATARQRLRFEREVEAVALLRHPNIVTVYESGRTASGAPYLAMEFVDGRPLDEFLRAGGRRPLGEVLGLFVRIGRAVNSAHQRGVIHRDLKPANILIDGSGEPRIVDFGLAKALNADEAAPGTITEVGDFLGTLAYASPEQARADPAHLDLRTDVYSLGVMLYHALAGRFPYAVAGPVRDVLTAITDRPPAPLRAGDCRVDPDLELVVMTALAKEPERRYQSAGALADDLEHYLRGEPIAARRDSALYVLGKTLRRYRLQTGAAAVFVLTLAVFSVTVAILYHRASTEAAKANQVRVFLEDTLASVEPDVPGQEATVRQALDEAVHWVGLALQDQPEVESALRTTIGNSYRSLGAFERAEEQLEQALRIRTALFGRRHPQVAQTLSVLGLVRRDRGELADAEGLVAEALDIRRATLGDRHGDVAMALMSLAEITRRRGQFDRALGMLREALAITSALRGRSHPDTAMCLYLLGELRRASGDAEDGLGFHEEALATRRRTLPGDHPDTGRSLRVVAETLLELNLGERAEALARETVALAAAAKGPDHWRTAEAGVLVGAALAAQGRFAEAEGYLLAAQRALESALGADDLRARDCVKRLVALYERWGRADEAARWRGHAPGP